MTEIAAPTSSPSLLRVLRYYLERYSSVVNPLVEVEFLVDMAAFLGPHTQDRCRSGADVEIQWPLGHDLKINPNPQHIMASFGSIANAPLASAINWRWMQSQRRVTRLQIAVCDYKHPESIPIVYISRSLPKSCHTLDDALAWLGTLGITADPLHAGCALILGH